MENRKPRQRDAQGRFLPGNTVSKGYGRPPRALEEQYMAALVQAMSVERFLQVSSVHAARAEAGDLATFRLFVRHLIGMPKMRADLTGDVVMRLAVFYDELTQAIGHGPPESMPPGEGED